MAARGGKIARGERWRRAVRRSSIGAALGALALACSAPAQQDEPVQVGVAVPFAGTELMLDARQGWELVLDAINESGGVNGRPLKVVERDTPLSRADDLSPIADGLVDLTSEGYRYIIALVSGSALVPMMRAATERGVLAMSITSEETSGEVQSYDGLLLRGILSTDRLIEKQARALQGAGLERMVIAGPTRGGVPDARETAMSAAYAACSGCAVSELTYPGESDGYLYDWL